MVVKQFMRALVVGGLIAVWVREWKEMRQAQQRARSILYPGNPEEMLDLLTELRRYRDQESQTLARQLEDRLKIRDRRAWRRASHRPRTARSRRSSSSPG